MTEVHRAFDAEGNHPLPDILVIQGYCSFHLRCFNPD